MKRANKLMTVLIFIFLYIPMAVLIGDVIERQFKQGNNPNLGAALSLVLMVLVFVCTGIMNRFGGDDAEGGVVV